MIKEIFRRLECEYLASPCGIAVKAPNLSWQGPAGRLQIFAGNGQLVFDSFAEVDSPFQPDWMPLPQQRYFWRLQHESWGAESEFETALDDAASWAPANWIRDPYNPGGTEAPTSVFQTCFKAPEWIKNGRGRLYIGALGLYSVTLNGVKITDAVLTPGAMDFSRRAIYQTYPVESFLSPGYNLLVFELAGGWHSGLIASTGVNYDRPFYGTQDALIVRLEAQKALDAPWELLCFSNSRTWQAFNQGPRRYSDIFLGEYFDARQDRGEPSPGIAEFENFLQLAAGHNPPVRRIMELQPCSVKRHGKSFIVDFGQNFAGRERIVFNAPRGTEIVIKHGEMLHDDGSLYTENLRSARAVTTIIAPGGEFTFEPEFTFYGFLYLEICGLEDFTVTAQVLHSELAVCGRCSSSNALLDRFMENVLWSQRSNFLDIPTDCPQRDERRGWTGDAQVFASTALFNMHCAAFFRKYLTDLRLCCSRDGRFPDYAPCYPYNDLQSSFGNSGWSDAGVVIPYWLYLHYGDKMILRESAPAIYKWIDYQARDLQQKNVCCHARYGDWLNINDPTSEEFISTAYFAYGATLASRIAGTLGDQEAGERMLQHERLVKEYFKHRFLSPDGELLERSQCAAAMALDFDLLDDSQRRMATAALSSSIKTHGHLTTGFLGTPLLLYALSNNNELDLAYKLLESTRCPSWLYPVTQGATTIWERWDSWNFERGFADMTMNSFNHYAYGASAGWVYQIAGGIQGLWEYPGFRKFKLAPQPGGSLQYLTVEYDSPAGLIKSGWRRSSSGTEYNFEIPVGTSAEVLLPGREKMELSAGKYTYIAE